MSRFFLAALLALSTSAAFAERPSTLAMSCRQAQNLVAQRGAVVLSTGRFTYDRFVASERFCAYHEYLYDGWAPTRDTTHCTLGYVCKPTPPIWDDEDHDSMFGD